MSYRTPTRPDFEIEAVEDSSQMQVRGVDLVRVVAAEPRILAARLTAGQGQEQTVPEADQIPRPVSLTSAAAPAPSASSVRSSHENPYGLAPSPISFMSPDANAVPKLSAIDVFRENPIIS